MQSWLSGLARRPPLIVDPPKWALSSTDRNEILHEHADCGSKSCEKLKLAHFSNSRGQMAPFWKSKMCNISTTDQLIATANITKDDVTFAAQ